MLIFRRYIWYMIWLDILYKFYDKVNISNAEFNQFVRIHYLQQFYIIIFNNTAGVILVIQ
jgi:hypothetical protein